MMLTRYRLIVIGGSAGATAALSELLPIFPAAYPLPIVVVQHLHPLQDRSFIERFTGQCALTVKEADDKEVIKAGHIYFAPPNYHLLVEEDKSFSLSIDEKVNYTRPSIDVLFASAADAYGPGLIGVILTGANHDGAQGLRLIKGRGGLTIVQDPSTAESAYMPRAALEATAVDHILSLQDIGRLLLETPQKGVV
ncbi:MAG: putative chemotaxis protein-glutamate methylesterase [Chloroflexota bacterium]|nr:MAG: putative chemotaxis protein-glutamate methylesterase [Chloroflexota bacterium]